MTISKETVDKRLAMLKREVLSRDFDRFPSVLKNISNLPADLQSPTVVGLAAAVQKIVVFPPQIHHGWHYVPRQALLFTSTGVIHMLASIWPDQQPQITRLKMDDLLYMRVTIILLYGFLEIVAQRLDSTARLGMEFNAVFWDLMSVSIRKFLQRTDAAPMERSAYSPQVQQALEKLPLKFSNGVRLHGVLPGEKLEDLIFQPATWKRWLLLFQKPILANTLLLLTSNYMVVIQEELRVGQGWIISYLPRENIVRMQNATTRLGHEMIVQLQRNGQKAEYKLSLDDEVAQTWSSHWDRNLKPSL
jgi:hypothetical protein